MLAKLGSASGSTCGRSASEAGLTEGWTSTAGGGAVVTVLGVKSSGGCWGSFFLQPTKSKATATIEITTDLRIMLASFHRDRDGLQAAPSSRVMYQTPPMGAMFSAYLR